MSELLKAHKILMDEILNNAGKFRTSNVRGGGYIASQSHLVPKLMGELFGWLNYAKPEIFNTD
jgi:Fic family protein